MEASNLRLLYKQRYGNVAVLSPMSFTKLYQMDQFVAGFFTDLSYLLQNINVVQTSSAVRGKKFLCSLYETHSLSLYCGHEEIVSSRNLQPL